MHFTMLKLDGSTDTEFLLMVNLFADIRKYIQTIIIMLMTGLRGNKRETFCTE